MRFSLAQTANVDDRFPHHVQWVAVNSDHPPIFFWLHGADGELGAKEFIRKRYPTATFSDEKVH